MDKSIIIGFVVVAVIGLLGFGLFSYLRRSSNKFDLPITPRDIVTTGPSPSALPESTTSVKPVASPSTASPLPSPSPSPLALASPSPSPSPVPTPKPTSKPTSTSKTTTTKTITFIAPSPSPVVFKVTNVTIVSSPATYSGSCPKDITFYATITTNGAGTVNYRFARSDGTETGENSISFDFASSKSVENIWSRSSSGWEKLKITSPNSLESSQASFNISCN